MNTEDTIKEYHKIQKQAEHVARQWVDVAQPGYQPYDIKIDATSLTVSFCVGHYDGIMISPLRASFPLSFLENQSELTEHALAKKKAYDENRKRLFARKDELLSVTNPIKELQEVQARIATQCFDNPEGYPYQNLLANFYQGYIG